MEVLNDLLGYKNLKIYQNPDWFSFSLDSVLLPNFVTLNKNIKNVLDLGCGNLPISMILTTKTDAKITAVEIQKDVYDLAVKNRKINNLEDRIDILNVNMLDLKDKYESDTFDVIVSNPPYFKYTENSNINEDEHKTIARHEKYVNLEQMVKLVKYLLKNNGVFAMVHRTDRLIEIINLLSSNNLIVKKIRFIYPKNGSESNLMLIEAMKNGKNGVKLLAPLYVHNEDGSYREEILKMFE